MRRLFLNGSWTTWTLFAVMCIILVMGTSADKLEKETSSSPEENKAQEPDARLALAEEEKKESEEMIKELQAKMNVLAKQRLQILEVFRNYSREFEAIKDKEDVAEKYVAESQRVLTLFEQFIKEKNKLRKELHVWTQLNECRGYIIESIKDTNVEKKFLPVFQSNSLETNDSQSVLAASTREVDAAPTTESSTIETSNVNSQSQAVPSHGDDVSTTVPASEKKEDVITEKKKAIVAEEAVTCTLEEVVTEWYVESATGSPPTTKVAEGSKVTTENDAASTTKLPELIEDSRATSVAAANTDESSAKETSIVSVTEAEAQTTWASDEARPTKDDFYLPRRDPNDPINIPAEGNEVEKVNGAEAGRAAVTKTTEPFEATEKVEDSRPTKAKETVTTELSTKAASALAEEEETAVAGEPLEKGSLGGQAREDQSKYTYAPEVYNSRDKITFTRNESHSLTNSTEDHKAYKKEPKKNVQKKKVRVSFGGMRKGLEDEEAESGSEKLNGTKAAPASEGKGGSEGGNVKKEGSTESESDAKKVDPKKIPGQKNAKKGMAAAK